MEDAVDQALGPVMRKLRTKRGWSEADLALRLGMDRNDLSLVELGRNSPSVRMLMRAVHGAECARGRSAGSMWRGPCWCKSRSRGERLGYE